MQKKMNAEQVSELAQFVQVARTAMEDQFENLGLKLLELDLGISGNKSVIVLPGAERYFFKGSVCRGMEVKDFRVDFAMSLGDTNLDSISGLVNDVVTKTAAGFGK